MANPPRTIQEIAKIADVPLDQALRVVLGQANVPHDIREKVLNVLKNVDSFHITTKTATTKTGIGIVMPGRVSDDYVGAVVQGVLDTAKYFNYPVVMNIQNRDREDSLVDLLSTEVEGVVVVVPANYDRLLELCHTYHRPYALVDYQGGDIKDAITVEVNNHEAIMAVMQHLFELGHRRIGFITGWLDHASARYRLQGYQDALAEAKIPYDSQLVREGNWLHPTAYQLTKELLNLPQPPTAIVASNDLSAFGVIQAVSEAGLVVGKNFSVTGFDDIPMAANITPPLTTVRQPGYEMGQIAAEMLVKRIRDEALSTPHMTLNTEFILRRSTAPAPH
jgi:LacI family transcriptional regulator